MKVTCARSNGGIQVVSFSRIANDSRRLKYELIEHQKRVIDIFDELYLEMKLFDSYRVSHGIVVRKNEERSAISSSVWTFEVLKNYKFEILARAESFMARDIIYQTKNNVFGVNERIFLLLANTNIRKNMLHLLINQIYLVSP